MAWIHSFGIRSVAFSPVDAMQTPRVPKITSTIGDGMMKAAGLPPSMKSAANTAMMPSMQADDGSRIHG